MPDPDSFARLIAPLDREIAAIATALRALVLEIDPSVSEVIWLTQGIAGYGVGPKKMTEHYVYIAPQKQHVNFGLYRGAMLDDPDGLLEGTGAQMRHVKVRDPGQNAGALRALVVAAIAERKWALGL